MWRRAVAAVAAVAVTFPQGTRGQDIATAEWEHEPCEHSAYRQRITELEAELAMYRQASTAGQVVCTLGGEHAQLVGGEGTYTISSNVTSAPCETSEAVLNLHVTESVEIELPGLVVRITDVMNGTAFNESRLDDDSEPDELQINIPGLGDVGMDVWSPFFGTLMAMIACCIFVVISSVLEKKFMCVGGEAIHSVLDEQKRVNRELHRFLGLVSPLVEHVERDQAIDEDLDALPGSPKAHHSKTKKMVNLITNDGEPMSTDAFMHNLAEAIHLAATPENARKAEEKIAVGAAAKVGGSKGSAAVKLGEKVYNSTRALDEDDSKEKSKHKKGKKKGRKKGKGLQSGISNPLHEMDLEEEEEEEEGYVVDLENPAADRK